MSKEKKIDMVSHPPHYEGSTSLECIQCMEVSMGKSAVSNFCLCNAFKYLWRYKHKNGKEVVAKASQPFDVDYFCCRGYVSQSEMWESAQRLVRHCNHERIVSLYI